MGGIIDPAGEGKRRGRNFLVEKGAHRRTYEVYEGRREGHKQDFFALALDTSKKLALVVTSQLGTPQNERGKFLEKGRRDRRKKQKNRKRKMVRSALGLLPRKIKLRKLGGE